MWARSEEMKGVREWQKRKSLFVGATERDRRGLEVE